MCSKNTETTRQQIPVLDGLLHLATSPSDQPYLIGSKCKLCGQVCFPKRLVCPVCIKGATMEEIPLNRRGIVTLFSVSKISQPGFPAPYVQAFVRLQDGPEIFSTIHGVDPNSMNLQVGAEVELVIDKIGEDKNCNDIVIYKFVPVGKS